MHTHSAFRAILPLILLSGGLQAALLTATPANVALSCNTLNGPGPAATIVVKPLATLTSSSLAVTMGAFGAGIIVTPPASATLTATNQAQGLTYTVSLAAGCAGATNGTTMLRFYVGGIADASVAAATTVTASASALVASPVTLTCSRGTGTTASYTPGPAQTVSVTSAAAGGTPFAVDSAANPAWLLVTPAAGGTAGSKAVSLTVSAVAPCGNYLPGTVATESIHLRNLPAPDALISVTLRILGPSPLTAAPAAPSLSYTRGSDTPAFVDVALTSSASPAPSFSVDSASLPPWLTVDALSGAAPQTLRFTTTNLADSIAQGSYSAGIRIQVSGSADLVVPFRLALANPAPKLTVTDGLVRDLSWTVGQPQPTPYVTLQSSESAIAYSIATGGPLAPIVSSSLLKGFAYSYGTPISLTFDPAVFATAKPGTVLTGTVTISWGTPATKTVVTVNITVQSAGAIVLAISPPNLPTATPGETFTVALTGAGFVSGSDPLQRTVVGIVSGGSLVADTNIASTVINPSNIIVTIAVPEPADALLPFSPTGAGGSVTLGVCNPAGTVCTVPTGTAQLSIGSAPLIQAVTSASAYVQVTPPTLAGVAGFDMVSLFGINFCTSRGTGCGDDTLYGTLDATTLRYPTALSHDPSGSAQRLLTVSFQTHATPPVLIARAPLFFATDHQINLLVPSAVAPFLGKSVDIVASFGSASSAPFTVNIVAADPGVFTVGGDGQGEGAVLGLDGAMITRGHEAAIRQNQADSEVVQIFVTGLGAPDSTADNAAAGGGLWPADCVGTASYLSSLNLLTSGSATSLDGAVVASGLLGVGRLAPCLRTTGTVPTVTIGGQPATVTYAGWVPDSVAGEYQINARLPGSVAFTAPPLTAPVQLPVVVTARGRASQPGVTMWVAPRLKVTATSSQVTASQGTAPYQYAVTSGSLPAGMVLNPGTGAIAGTSDVPGSYAITVTATDSAAKPLSGAATFTLTVAAR